MNRKELIKSLKKNHLFGVHSLYEHKGHLCTLLTLYMSVCVSEVRGGTLRVAPISPWTLPVASLTGTVTRNTDRPSSQWLHGSNIRYPENTNQIKSNQIKYYHIISVQDSGYIHYW